MYQEKMTRLNIYLPGSMMLALTRLADRRGVTMASLLRQAVEDILAAPTWFAPEKEAPLQARKELEKIEDLENRRKLYGKSAF